MHYLYFLKTYKIKEISYSHSTVAGGFEVIS